MPVLSSIALALFTGYEDWSLGVPAGRCKYWRICGLCLAYLLKKSALHLMAVGCMEFQNGWRHGLVATARDPQRQELGKHKPRAANEEYLACSKGKVAW